MRAPRGGALALAALGVSACVLAGVAWRRLRRARQPPSRAGAAPTAPAAPAHADARPQQGGGPGARSRGRAPPRVRVLCASTAAEQVRCVSSLARPSDRVLVVGSTVDEVLQALVEATAPSGARAEQLGAAGGGGGGGGGGACARAPRVVVLDIARKGGDTIRSGCAAARADELGTTRLDFVCTDACSARAWLDAGDEFELIFLDIPVLVGNDLLSDGLALVRQLVGIYAGSCRALVLKSRLLATHASHTVDAIRWRDELATLRAAPPPRPPPRPRGAARAGGGEGGGGGGPAPSPPSAAPPRHVTVCAMGVLEYRQAVLAALSPDDLVLEIGCHSGVTARLVHGALAGMGGRGAVVGVDVGRSVIEHARKRSPAGLRLEVADGWDVRALIGLGHAFSIVLVDVGGLSGHDGPLEALALLRQLRAAFAESLRLTVIKSKCMRDHAISFRDAPELWRPDWAGWRRCAEQLARATPGALWALEAERARARGEPPPPRGAGLEQSS